MEKLTPIESHILDTVIHHNADISKVQQALSERKVKDEVLSIKEGELVKFTTTVSGPTTAFNYKMGDIYKVVSGSFIIPFDTGLTYLQILQMQDLYHIGYRWRVATEKEISILKKQKEFLLSEIANVFKQKPETTSTTWFITTEGTIDSATDITQHRDFYDNVKTVGNKFSSKEEAQREQKWRMVDTRLRQIISEERGDWRPLGLTYKSFLIYDFCQDRIGYDSALYTQTIPDCYLFPGEVFKKIKTRVQKENLLPIWFKR